MKSILEQLFHVLWPRFDVVTAEAGQYDWHGNLDKFTINEHCEFCGVPFETLDVPHAEDLTITAGEEGVFQRFCTTCLVDLPLYDRHRALFVYDGIIREMIHGFKYNAEFWVLDFMRAHLKNLVVWFSVVDGIVPIPLTQGKMRHRGYNQSWLIACLWRDILKKPIWDHALYRTTSHGSQTQFNRELRQKNMRGVFEVSDCRRISGRRILLVDDVHTTGATLSEAARVLKLGGAEKVYATTLAVVPSKS